ncbi:hypothetical protein HK103_000560 [Boothiomyces macroporosus]|uniref:asparaginase n=1 Tax=Boothiomyces macroporosus TaxID=261099 RepID=A0AAD5UK55_9FUNG|nr:hypothetical protein HK103_000560 [Boothiomyces macroporosus]
MQSQVYINDSVNSQLDNLMVNNMVPVDMTRVLIIYTGGTIGMKNSAGGYKPEEGYITQKLAQNPRFHDLEDDKLSLFNSVNVSVNPDEQEYTHMINGINVQKRKLLALITPYSLFNKRTRYSILEYNPLLDSSNMTMSDWIKIATDIEMNYELYDAFVVLHGTDTMAYTASALSFLLENLGKTVILTGSQVPISEVRTDAIDNLLGALTIAGHFIIPEVGLFFDNKLFRGNRSSKVNAIEFNAFESPNLRPLVHVGINIDVSWENIWQPKRIARFRVQKTLNSSVASLRLFPGITEATVKAFFSPAIKGVVLETYGSGNAPTNRKDILAILKDACDRGVVIVNCSQCKKATVTSLYETGMALLNIGVVPGSDMTPECALTKLSYLLGKYEDDPAKVRSLIRKNLRGELTVVSRRQRFTYQHPSALLSSHNALIGSVMNLLGVVDPSSVQPTPLDSSFDMKRRNSTHDIESGTDGEYDTVGIERQLVPLAYCHSARQGDVKTLSLLIQEFEFMINQPNNDGITALHAAAVDNQLEAVQLLLRHGANVHLRDKFGRSPLFNAVYFQHKEIALLLRQAGAHFAQEEASEIANQLFESVSRNDLERIKLLIDCGVNPNIANEDGRTILHQAATSNKIEIINYLLSLSGQEPLAMSRSASASSIDDAKYIPQHIEVNLEPKDRWGRTPLMDAKTFYRTDVIYVLERALKIRL